MTQSFVCVTCMVASTSMVSTCGVCIRKHYFCSEECEITHWVGADASKRLVCIQSQIMRVAFTTEGDGAPISYTYSRAGGSESDGEELPGVPSCWWCGLSEVPMHLCPMCYAAHYCSHECELADRVQGHHRVVCCSSALPRELAQAVYRASRGLCGVDLHRSRFPGGLRYPLVMVAKCAAQPGTRLLCGPVGTGFMGTLGYVTMAREHLQAAIANSTVFDAVAGLPSAHEAERLLVAMLLQVIAAITPTAEARRDVQRKFFMALKHHETDLTKFVLEAFKTARQFLPSLQDDIISKVLVWIMQESSIVSRFWKDLAARRTQVKFDVDAARQLYASQKVRRSMAQVIRSMCGDDEPERRWVTQLIREVDEKLENVRKEMPRICQEVLRLWQLAVIVSPYLGLESVNFHGEAGLMPGVVHRLCHPVTKEYASSIGFVHAFLAHSCVPNACVSTTRIYEGIVDFKAEGMQNMGFSDRMFSSSDGMLMSRCAVYAHTPIRHGDVVKVSYCKVQTLEQLRMGCTSVLKDIEQVHFWARDALQCTCHTFEHTVYFRALCAEYKVRNAHIAFFSFLMILFCHNEFLSCLFFLVYMGGGGGAGKTAAAPARRCAVWRGARDVYCTEGRHL